MTTNNDSIGRDDRNRVSPDMACPRCGEDDIDRLLWIDDDQVRCTGCGTIYQPGHPQA